MFNVIMLSVAAPFENKEPIINCQVFLPQIVKYK
jgi:hypothetical protein